MTVHRLEGQKLAGTSLDSQGERLALEDLQDYVDFCRGRKLPLHQQHQMGEPTTGFIENVRLVQDDNTAEWVVIGDVTIESGAFDKGMRGFSISFIKPLVEREHADCLLYIPYPHYNNHEFVAQLATDQDLKIGKWVKKSADNTAYALFGATIMFALTPVWDHFYKSRVAPIVDRFLDEHLEPLGAKGISLEHVQVVLHGGYEVELRFIPERGKERWCFAQQCITAGIALVAQRLQANPIADEHGVQRVVLRYSIPGRAYEVSRIEYRNGHTDV